MNTELRKLSFSTREQLHDAVSSVIEKVTGDKTGTKLDRIEKSLVRYLAKGFKDRGNRAIGSALAVIQGGDQTAAVTKKQAEAMLAKVEDAYAGFENDTAGRVKKDFNAFYRENKERFAQRFKLKTTKESKTKGTLVFVTWERNQEGTLVPCERVVKSVKTIRKEDLSIIASFGVKDTRTIEKLVKLANLAIGDHFPANLKPNVTKLIMEGVFERGLNKKNAAEYLKKELTKLTGATDFALPEFVKEGGDRVDAYFKGLVGTDLNLARNLGAGTAMEEAGIARYRWFSIIDNLTSDICLEMDGRVFDIKYIIEHREKILSLNNVEELKQYAPWQKDLSAFNLKAGERLDDPKVADQLKGIGLLAPPAHFRCRSEIHPD